MDAASRGSEGGDLGISDSLVELLEEGGGEGVFCFVEEFLRGEGLLVLLCRGFDGALARGSGWGVVGWVVPVEKKQTSGSRGLLRRVLVIPFIDDVLAPKGVYAGPMRRWRYSLRFGRRLQSRFRRTLGWGNETGAFGALGW